MSSLLLLVSGRKVFPLHSTFLNEMDSRGLPRDADWLVFCALGSLTPLCSYLLSNGEAFTKDCILILPNFSVCTGYWIIPMWIKLSLDGSKMAVSHVICVSFGLCFNCCILGYDVFLKENGCFLCN